jgi:hypothetical protein
LAFLSWTLFFAFAFLLIAFSICSFCINLL